MATLTVIRHGQQKSHQHIDPPLMKIPPALDVPYDLIICSPYQRCRETAIEINNRHVEILVDVRICEFQSGKNHRTKTMNPSSLLYGPIPSYDETWEQCRERLDQFWDETSQLQRNILICTHGIVVNYLYEKVTGKKLYKRGRDVPFGNGFTVKIA